MKEGLNPGDKVIALAAAASTAAIVAGATAGAVAAWIASNKALVSFAGLVGGAAIGWIVGMIVGKIVFPSSSGNVMIVKWGASSLHLTLKGNILASLITALIICAGMVITGSVEFRTIADPCIGTSVVLGAILALLASLI